MAAKEKTIEAAALLAAVRGVRLETLDSINRKEIAVKVPIFKGLLFPGAWLFVGRPKIGKSWILMQGSLAAAEEGGSLLGFDATEPVEVLYVAGEDDHGRMQSRMRALGVARAPAGVHVIDQGAFCQLAKEFGSRLTFTQFLDAWLDAHPRVRLVLLDTETTVRQLWSGETVESATAAARVTESDYKRTREFDELALRRQIAIILVNHARKRGRQDDMTDIHEIINRSNTALAGCSGSIVLADMPGSDPLDTTNKDRLFGVRGRDLADDITLAVRHGNPDEVPCFVSRGPYVEIQQTDAEEEVLRTVLELMEDEPDRNPGEYFAASEIAEELGKKRDTVKRVISRMGPRKAWRGHRVVMKKGRGGGIRLDPT
jgi:AAA domain